MANNGQDWLQSRRCLMHEPVVNMSATYRSSPNDTIALAACTRYRPWRHSWWEVQVRNAKALGQQITFGNIAPIQSFMKRILADDYRDTVLIVVTRISDATSLGKLKLRVTNSDMIMQDASWGVPYQGDQVENSSPRLHLSQAKSKVSVIRCLNQGRIRMDRRHLNGLM